MKKVKIYLIEDCLKNADLAIAVLNEAAPRYSNEDFEYSFEFLPGTNEGRDGYVFYEQGIIEQIKDKIEEERNEGNLAGLLLDTLLTQEDFEYALANYYGPASLSREIYSEFNKTIPVYIVTITAVFASQSGVIMGLDLSDRFISNRSLRTRDQGEIRDLFSFYQKFYAEEKSAARISAE